SRIRATAQARSTRRMSARPRDNVCAEMESRRSSAYDRQDVADSRDVLDGCGACSSQTHVLRHPLAVKKPDAMPERFFRADKNGSSEVRRAESRSVHHYLLPVLCAGQEFAQEQGRGFR